MGTLTVYELLKREIESLPEALAEEAFDFILFMKARRAEESFLWQQIEETRSYRQQHPEEVMTVTSEEWDTFTSHLEDDV